MVDYAEARRVVETYLAAQWAETPIYWDNVEAAPPGSQPWIRVTLTPSYAERRALGCDGTRAWGYVATQVFVPVGAGTELAYSLARQLTELLDSQDFGSVHTLVSSITRAGDDKRGYWMLLINTPLYIEEQP